MIPLFLPFSHLAAVYGIYSESGKPLQIKDLLTTTYRGLLCLCKFKSRLAHQIKRHAAACLLIWVPRRAAAARLRSHFCVGCIFYQHRAKSRTPSEASCFLRGAPDARKAPNSRIIVRLSENSESGRFDSSRTLPDRMSCLPAWFLLFFRTYKLKNQTPVSARQPGFIASLKVAVIRPVSSALHTRSVRRILDSDGSKSAARPVICTQSSKNLPLFFP